MQLHILKEKIYIGYYTGLVQLYFFVFCLVLLDKIRQPRKNIQRTKE